MDSGITGYSPDYAALHPGYLLTAHLVGYGTHYVPNTPYITYGFPLSQE